MGIGVSLFESVKRLPSLANSRAETGYRQLVKELETGKRKFIALRDHNQLNREAGQG